MVLERLAADEPATSPLLFFAVRSGNAPLSTYARRRIEFELAGRIEATCQTEVDNFCREFFDLELETRRARWTALRERTSASPALVARLENLSQGLEVEFWRMSDESPAVQRVAALVRELFVSHPSSSDQAARVACHKRGRGDTLATHRRSLRGKFPEDRES